MAVTVLGPRASERLLRAAWLAILARILLVAGLITTPVALLNYDLWKFLYLMFLAVFALVMTVYLGLAVVLRCPGCGKRFLIESTDPNHPAARRAKHFDHWGTLVLSVMRNREFTCMHCGSLYRRESSKGESLERDDTGAGSDIPRSSIHESAIKQDCREAHGPSKKLVES